MKKGFTLIELLIVIALLGALAVGLLAALDPFEQIKKGTDTGVRNTVSELHGAIIRYYAIKNKMPWGTTPINDVASGITLYISDIISTGELKSDFIQLAGDQLSKITLVGTSESITVCFKPDSRAFRTDPNTKYLSNFSETTNNIANCGDPGTVDFHCYWCVK
ncbi:MAG: prepilin-type N-terminal cleavage/methylation domain-containing protein [Microgenomates group bacterium]|nr:prepilin-type N-terminal cleavage/methylation domain-containing protein [Microgenomates group bacterium]